MKLWHWFYVIIFFAAIFYYLRIYLGYQIGIDQRGLTFLLYGYIIMFNILFPIILWRYRHEV